MQTVCAPFRHYCAGQKCSQIEVREVDYTTLAAKGFYDQYGERELLKLSEQLLPSPFANPPSSYDVMRPIIMYIIIVSICDYLEI